LISGNSCDVTILKIHGKRSFRKFVSGNLLFGKNHVLFLHTTGYLKDLFSDVISENHVMLFLEVCLW